MQALCSILWTDCPFLSFNINHKPKAQGQKPEAQIMDLSETFILNNILKWDAHISPMSRKQALYSSMWTDCPSVMYNSHCQDNLQINDNDDEQEPTVASPS